jgi:hypothetical protein
MRKIIIRVKDKNTGEVFNLNLGEEKYVNKLMLINNLFGNKNLDIFLKENNLILITSRADAVV